MKPVGPGRSVGVMQPYVFPYLGYFQLIDAVDVFVCYDDVTFIKGGWINRNAILAGGERQPFTIPVSGASSHREIRKVRVTEDPRWRKKLLATIAQSYGGAPHFEAVLALIERVLGESGGRSIAEVARRSLTEVLGFLDLQPEIVETSSGFGNRDLGRVERLVDICRRLDSSTLVNPIGGQDLYDREEFRAAGIDLRFLEMRPVAYPQTGARAFVPNLSIIDVLMNLGPDGARALLSEYDLR